MNKSILSLAIVSSISLGSQAAVQDLLITEMVQKSYGGEWGSIEITNTHATESFQFSDATAAYLVSNGKYENKLLLEGGQALLTGLNLAPGASVVILNDAAEDAYKQSILNNGGQFVVGSGDSNTKYSDFYLSGNDGFVIKHNNAVIDRVGAQGNGSVWAADTTLRRRMTAEGDAPTQNPAFLSTEWLEFTPLETDGMGSAALAPAFTPFVCADETNISVIQGNGQRSTMEGENVVVKGVVTAVTDLPRKGFYLRDLIGDNDSSTSDGIFVKSDNASSTLVGQTICLGSKVSESDGNTQLSADTWEVLDAAFTPTSATDIEVLESDKGLFANTLERYEGMLVNLPRDLDPATEGEQSMRITRSVSFNYDSFRNNLSLAYLRPNMQPNQLNVAGSDASFAAAAQNEDYRLVIESSTKAANGELPYYPQFGIDPANNAIRIDDAVIGMEGVLSHNDSGFALTVTNELTASNFEPHYKRTKTPDLNDDAQGDQFSLTVATQNLYNFFTSPFGGDQNNFGQSRGADTYDEFVQQKTKLVETLRSLNADVIGLMEMENNGFGTNGAIAELVNEVNTYYNDERVDAGAPNSTENRYVFVGFDFNGDQILDSSDAIGSDAVATGLLYRPSKVSVERAQVIVMPQQKAPVIVNDNGEVVKDNNGDLLEDGQNYNRDALVVTFVVNQTGKRLTIAVNHFKSKGSTCWEDWQGVDFGDATVWTKDAPNADLQGSCAEFRNAASVQLGDELAKIPGDKIIIGDLNSYAKEDPVLVLTENPTNRPLVTASHTYIQNKPQFNNGGAPKVIEHTYGYIDIIGKVFKAKGKTPWSYSYSDEVGSLDHILISPELESRVIDATDWHINAAESALYDYNMEFKGDYDNLVNKFYAPTPYRSSDHDPALISLSYLPGEVDSGKIMRLTKKNNIIQVPYHISADIGAQAGDVAKVTLSPKNSDEKLDLSQLVEPNVVLNSDSTSMINFDVFGAPSATYSVRVVLTRNGNDVEKSAQRFDIEVRSRDSLVPEIIEEPADGSGGSTPIWALLSLLGLTLLRRR